MMKSHHNVILKPFLVLNEACFDNRHFDHILIASLFVLEYCFSLANLDLEIVKRTLVICGMFIYFHVCQNFTCFKNSVSVQVN